MTARTKLTFTQWMAEVDAKLDMLCGMSSADLDDCNYKDWYSEGVSPKQAAGRAFRYSNGE